MSIDNKKKLSLPGDDQKKFSFDRKTIKKIFKGALIAGTGGGALFVLNSLQVVETGPCAPIIASLVPTMINMVKEWMKGQ